MSRIRLAGMMATVLLIAGTTLARAGDISTKKFSIKDNADTTKRQIQVSSSDVGVQFSDLGDPSADGATIHIYSATDDFCLVLQGGTGWVNKGSVWKYSDKETKDSAQVGDQRLAVKIKSGITYSLMDNGTQGAVNAQVQFGTGTRYCMRCSSAKKDTPTSFSASACVIAACDPEPTICAPGTSTSTSTTTGTSTTSTTLCSQMGMVVKGSLTPTPGRFNYNVTLGLPGANSACNMNFAGTHACTYAELQAAQAASDLAGLKDTACNTVTSFWAIDSSQPPLQQCQDDAAGGSGLNWEYGTAHTASRGQKVDLTNVTGVLGPLQSSLQCNLSGTSWVGCCQ